jgi:hypothetical protein
MKKPPVPSAQGVDWIQMRRPSVVVRGSRISTVGSEEYGRADLAGNDRLADLEIDICNIVCRVEVHLTFIESRRPWSLRARLSSRALAGAEGRLV